MTDDDEPRSRRPSLRLPALRLPVFRRPSAALMRGGARGAGVLGAAAVGLGVILIASALTGSISTIAAPRLTIQPTSAAEVRLCAGPVVRLGGASGSQATVATSAGQPIVVSASRPGEAQRAPLSVTDNVTGVAPELLTLAPSTTAADSTAPPEAPELAASQSEAVDAGTFAGFAAADCLEATSEAWISAGATTVGRTALISISNPSSVEATVDLTIWGDVGEVSAPGTTGIIVPPGTQRIYPLAGFAPGLTSTVVRVESRGGPVVATMHESIVRTLVAGGVDIVGPTSAPDTSVTIPGVVIANSAAVTAAGAELGFDDLGPVIRLLNPGTGTANASVTIVRAEGSATSMGPQTVVPDAAVPDAAVPDPAVPDPAVPDPVVPAAGNLGGTPTFTVSLEPGVVLDLPIQGLADGVYTVSVTSSAPVTASARVNTITPAGLSDLAWVASGEALGATSLVAVAPGPSPILTMANPTGETISVTMSDGDSGLEFDVEPEASVAVAVSPRASLVLTGTDGLVAAVSYHGPGALATFPVSVPLVSSTAVRVYR